MRRGGAAVVCAVAFAALAGCADWRRQPPPRLSIKDHAPAKAALPVPPRPELPAAAPKAALPAPPKADLPPSPTTEPPAMPKAELHVPHKAEPSIEDRAKREQANWCGQRHVEHNAGTLEESHEQKRVLDDQCAELHKRDYVR